MESEKRID